MSDSEILSAMRASKFASGFSDGEIAALAKACTRREFSDGENIVTEGDEGNSCFFIVSGRARIAREKGVEQRRVLGSLGPGEFFGIVALIQPVGRTASVIAAGNVVAAELDGATFKRLYDAVTPGAIRFQLLVAKQLGNDARRLNRIFFKAAEQADEAATRAELAKA